MNKLSKIVINLFLIIFVLNAPTLATVKVGDIITTDQQITNVQISSSSPQIIAQLPSGTDVKILSESGEWYGISFGNNYKGWISKKFVKGSALPVATYRLNGQKLATHNSDTLKISLEKITYANLTATVSKIWMADPSNQVKKATCEWGSHCVAPIEMAGNSPGTVLAINGSGFFSPNFPNVPSGFPGDKSNYYYTTHGSLVVNNGQVVRNIAKFPFFGFAVTDNGIIPYATASTASVLANNPKDTFSFEPVSMFLVYDSKALAISDGATASRTVFGKIDDNNFFTITVSGASLQALTSFSKALGANWAYNLDGGGSTTLIFENTVMYGGNRKLGDILCITE